MTLLSWNVWATGLRAFCHYGLLARVVFISHFCRRPFEWKQWALLPWTLFHSSKDKREAWKEETRPAHSQTQQEQLRAIDSHVSPPCPYHTGKASLALGRREQRNCVAFTTHKQVPALWSCSRKIKKKQTSLLVVFCLIRAKGTGRGQRSKQPHIKMIIEFPFQVVSMVHAMLTVQLLLLATVWIAQLGDDHHSMLSRQ